ncbi:MAG: hypothetical protein ACP5D8_01315 [Fidelibacterota bacterium]
MTKNNYSLWRAKGVRIWLIFGLILFLLSITASEADSQEAGCLSIVCDADNVPIYINGSYAGKSPLPVECNVAPGNYLITFFPPVSDKKIKYLDRKTYLDILYRSSRECRVFPGDTAMVMMTWQPVMLELAHLDKEYQRTRWTLIGVSGLILLAAAGLWVVL